jgi:glycosyltransferase involved in cell wall biosynthesis
MHIVFNIKALGNEGGGAERVLINIASGLFNRGHEITIITSDSKDSSIYYNINDCIKIIKLGIGSVVAKSNIRDIVDRIIKFRLIIKNINPDIVVSFMHSSFLLTGIALIGTRIPMIASEHAPPEHYRKHFFQKILIQLTPFIASKITVVTHQIFNSYGWWLRRSMSVVLNPVTVSASKRNIDSQVKQARLKTILSVGRLGPEKNHRCLISAFAIVSPIYPDWCLRIVGEGILRADLEAQTRSLGLQDKIFFPGAISDVDSEYLNSDIFVSPSLYESFGLATVEALLHGLPAVGFNDCQGTNDLIIHNENGMLVSGQNRIQSLALILRELMGNQQELNRLSNAPKDRLLSMFDIDSVLDSWEILFMEVLNMPIPIKSSAANCIRTCESKNSTTKATSIGVTGVDK